MGDADRIAEGMCDLLGTGRQIVPITETDSEFGLSQAYEVTAKVRALRERSGARVVGRKIGFTNRTIWDEYQVFAPIWGYVYDQTLHDLPGAGDSFSLAGLPEPRIEPEIVFGLKSAPQAGMSIDEISDCVEWVAHGFEIVQSVFPDWRFAPADTIAAFGLHGALLIGPRHAMNKGLAGQLDSFELTLTKNGHEIDRGQATNVLDGPLSALRHLVQVLAVDEVNPPIGAGEIVTTGTVTRAFPIAAGERWGTQVHGLDVDGAHIEFV